MGNESVQSILDECVPLIRQLAEGRYAISVGGSRGKGIADHTSDVDFRLFADRWAQTEASNAAREAFSEICRRRENDDIKIDGVWQRTIVEIEQGLNAWLTGNLAIIDEVWTIWGYHLLPDINNQLIVEDPSGIMTGWQDRLRVYPPALKSAILEKHLGSLRYWRQDYHYINKVRRGDTVFLAGLSVRLVHDIMQVLFALNETYYVGDGNNLDYAEGFDIKPRTLRERVGSILYPSASDAIYKDQRQALMELIEEVEGLALAH